MRVQTDQTSMPALQALFHRRRQPLSDAPLQRLLTAARSGASAVSRWRREPRREARLHQLHAHTVRSIRDMQMPEMLFLARECARPDGSAAGQGSPPVACAAPVRCSDCDRR